MRAVLHTAAEFNAELANYTLGPVLAHPADEVIIHPLGEGVGLMSAIARAELKLTDGSSMTVIVKYPAENANADISKGLNFYANELNYYQHIASTCPIPTPRCLYSNIEPDTQNFLLILEDLDTATPGDQLASCTETVMTKAFTQAAEMHGRFWNKTTQWPWLNYHNDDERNLFRRDAIYQPGVEPTLALFPEYFTGNLENTVRTIGERFVELFERAMAGPQTFIHGDYRTDNMLFDEDDKTTSVIAVDWQNSGGGRGAHDIAYFSSQSCGAELRGKPELAMLRQYHDCLLGEGVTGYSFDECLDDYRANLLITMITPVAVCGTLDPGNERGMGLGRVMLERSLAALTSMECANLL